MIRWALAGALIGWLAARRSDDGKTQLVRLVDVGVLGPALIGMAFYRSTRPQDRKLLALAGGATVTYNAANWWRARA